MYTYIHTYMHTYIHIVHTYNTYIHISSIYMYMRTYINSNIHVYIYICMHTYIVSIQIRKESTCIHTHIHTYIHTYTYLQRLIEESVCRFNICLGFEAEVRIVHQKQNDAPRRNHRLAYIHTYIHTIRILKYLPKIVTNRDM